MSAFKVTDVKSISYTNILWLFQLRRVCEGEFFF